VDFSCSEYGLHTTHIQGGINNLDGRSGVVSLWYSVGKECRCKIGRVDVPGIKRLENRHIRPVILQIERV